MSSACTDWTEQPGSDTTKLAWSVDGEPMSCAQVVTEVDTTTYSVQSSDCILYFDSSGGDQTIFLEDVTNIANRTLEWVKISSDANVITLTAVSGQLINGKALFQLALQYSAGKISTDGSNWYINSQLGG